MGMGATRSQCVSSSPGAKSGVSTFCTTGLDGNSGGGSKSPGSLPARAIFMKSIQIGKAACAPVSFGPRDFFSSKPTQTPQVIDGEKPTNQASVELLVVPVFPARGYFMAVGLIP